VALVTLDIQFGVFPVPDALGNSFAANPQTVLQLILHRLEICARIEVTLLVTEPHFDLAVSILDIPLLVVLLAN
jgi:hypothetical protein